MLCNEAATATVVVFVGDQNALENTRRCLASGMTIRLFTIIYFTRFPPLPFTLIAMTMALLAYTALPSQPAVSCIPTHTHTPSPVKF